MFDQPRRTAQKQSRNSEAKTSQTDDTLEDGKCSYIKKKPTTIQ